MLTSLFYIEEARAIRTYKKVPDRFLLLNILDMVFELQNKLMKKLLFKKMIYLFFKLKKNLLQRDFQSKSLQYMEFIATKI